MIPVSGDSPLDYQILNVLQHTCWEAMAETQHLVHLHQEGVLKVTGKAPVEGDTESIRLDLRIEQFYLDALQERMPCPFRFIGEEEGAQDFGATEPEIVLWIDPVDGSELAARDLPLWCTAACAYDRSKQEFVAAVVTEEDLRSYYTARCLDGAYVTRVHRLPVKIEVSKVTRLEDAALSVYGMTVQRILQHSAEYLPLLERVKRFTTFSGHPLLCRLATGGMDIVMDLVGYYAHDLLAGAYICRQAGAVVTPIDVESHIANPKHRYRFVAAATQELYDEVVAVAPL
ncbi:MAG: hypothetical protein AUJ92_17040 [Armatimonadetes bacterium CG2_30_59_28]|nr:hypothetical protein [Armatimonadota bacterium]OIO91188.1 MAG: hypothetical protein AUJ92_17040 [Armatimonadetes bacterium CG2_30_59_28]PIU60788.1 MAG: hypothetical protein COS85_22655 [Armatimonadetes bacterium CG07_land_8_20_14_0_80_59_28]PIX44391.1 MAG: hypothetical protein COZ56_04655 [Armatimonadetes bacterium CG_4_8_14_3_um_filter_58_9]PIY42007.1 MAG: hypothetical protein COZ05_14745 [Armatimonadetes bacterium CG_4_10_14_3_um_filter_59_10]PJB65105.1 MAG: hypothetical protein CO095_143